MDALTATLGVLATQVAANYHALMAIQHIDGLLFVLGFGTIAAVIPYATKKYSGIIDPPPSAPPDLYHIIEDEQEALDDILSDIESPIPLVPAPNIPVPSMWSHPNTVSFTPSKPWNQALILRLGHEQTQTSLWPAFVFSILTISIVNQWLFYKCSRGHRNKVAATDIDMKHTVHTVPEYLLSQSATPANASTQTPAMVADVMGLHREVQDLAFMNKNLVGQIEVARDQEEAAVKIALNLHAEKEAVVKAAHEAQAERAVAARTAREATERKEAAEDRIKDLNQRLADHQAETTTLRIQLAQLNKSTSDSDSERAKSISLDTERVGKLQEELDAAREAATQAISERDEARTQASKGRKEVAASNARLRQAESDSAERVKDLETRLEETMPSILCADDTRSKISVAYDEAEKLKEQLKSFSDKRDKLREGEEGRQCEVEELDQARITIMMQGQELTELHQQEVGDTAYEELSIERAADNGRHEIELEQTKGVLEATRKELKDLQSKLSDYDIKWKQAMGEIKFNTKLGEDYAKLQAENEALCERLDDRERNVDPGETAKLPPRILSEIREEPGSQYTVQETAQQPYLTDSNTQDDRIAPKSPQPPKGSFEKHTCKTCHATFTDDAKWSIASSHEDLCATWRREWESKSFLLPEKNQRRRIREPPHWKHRKDTVSKPDWLVSALKLQEEFNENVKQADLDNYRISDTPSSTFSLSAQHSPVTPEFPRSATFGLPSSRYASPTPSVVSPFTPSSQPPLTTSGAEAHSVISSAEALPFNPTAQAQTHDAVVQALLAPSSVLVTTSSTSGDLGETQATIEQNAEDSEHAAETTERGESNTDSRELAPVPVISENSSLPESRATFSPDAPTPFFSDAFAADPNGTVTPNFMRFSAAHNDPQSGKKPGSDTGVISANRAATGDTPEDNPFSYIDPNAPPRTNQSRRVLPLRRTRRLAESPGTGESHSASWEETISMPNSVNAAENSPLTTITDTIPQQDQPRTSKPLLTPKHASPYQGMGASRHAPAELNLTALKTQQRVQAQAHTQETPSPPQTMRNAQPVSQSTPTSTNSHTHSPDVQAPTPAIQVSPPAPTKPPTALWSDEDEDETALSALQRQHRAKVEMQIFSASTHASAVPTASPHVSKAPSPTVSSTAPVTPSSAGCDFSAESELGGSRWASAGEPGLETGPGTGSAKRRTPRGAGRMYLGSDKSKRR